MIHILKTVEPHYSDLNKGKNCEIRKNDRDYKPGDYLVLAKYDPETKQFQGGWVVKIVLHVTDYNQKNNFVVLSTKEVVLSSFYETAAKVLIQSFISDHKGVSS